MTEVSFYNNNLSFTIKGYSLQDAKELISILMNNKPTETVVEEQKPAPVQIPAPVEIPVPVEIKEPNIVEEKQAILPDIVPEENYENLSDDELKSVSSEPVERNIIVNTEYKELPEFEKKSDFCKVLTEIGISEKSHKNYWMWYDHPIFDSMRRRDIDDVAVLLQGEILENRNKPVRLIYNLFCVIFKINTYYKIFQDETKLRVLFEPVKALKTQQSTTKNTEKKTS